MKLPRRVVMGASLIPFLLACSDDKTILSVNVNMGSDKLNRRASLWQPIEVTIAGTTSKTLQLALQTREEDVIQLQANGSAVLKAVEGDTTGKMEPAKEKAPAVKNQWFERIELDGWSGSATVTAKTTGAYFVDEKVGDQTYPKSMAVTFSTGMATVTAGGIKIDLTPTPIEEEGVSAVFLNFAPPQAEMPMGGSGGGGGGGGKAAGGGGAGGAGAPATGGAATGGTATGGTATGGKASMAGAGGMTAGGSSGGSGGATSGAGGSGGAAGGAKSDGPGGAKSGAS